MSPGTIRSFNPAAPAELVGEVEAADRAGATAALDRAVTAQASWKLDAPGRSAALTALGEAVAARADRFTELMVKEVGKPRAEAAGELQRALAILRYYSQVALDPDGEILPGSVPGASVVVRHEPLGVVLAICPWNFPLAIPLWKAAPAMAYGNTVLLKPASAAVTTAELLIECADEALPDGVLASLPMAGTEVDQLLDEPAIAAVTFTGSTWVGTGVAERMARRAAPTQAEMGGQNPAVVLADANLDAAADAIVAGAMGYSGQKCTATRRVIAVAEVAEELFGKIAARVDGLEVGDPATDSVTAGPLISDDAASDFDRAVADALEAGATELARATLPVSTGPGPAGHYVRPAFLRQDDPGATVNREETFGPLLTALSVADDEAAVEAANATDYGLVAAVHGRDLGRAVEVASRIECGLLRINAPTPGVDYYAPFGGEKNSSHGPREQGRAAREFFTTSRTMTIVPAPD
ncbi:MAG: aldehyde dehydrogenase family protein [Solirubrobacterales bacterium]|nr:aldehyde dehydrogenase family protein [Solirubrobacterales bacterium]